MPRIALFGLVLCLLATACGDPQPADDPGPSGSEGSVAAATDLPTVARLGALPPSKGLVTLAITAAGVLTVDGQPCAVSALAERLGETLPLERPRPRTADEPPRKVIRARMEAELVEEELEDATEDAGPVREREIDAEMPVIQGEDVQEDEVFETEDPAEGGSLPGPGVAKGAKQGVVDLPPRDPGPRVFAPVEPSAARPVNLLFVIAPSVPWRAVAELMLVCADPQLRLYRIFVAVKEQGSGARGAVAAFLPVDRGLCGGRLVISTDVRMRLGTPGKRAAVASVGEALAAYREAPEDALFVTLRADPQAPWGEIVALMDEALRAGVYAFLFEGLPPTDTAATFSFKVLIEEARGAGPFVVTLRGEAVAQPAPWKPVAAGVREGYFGFGNAVTMGEPEITEEEIEEREAAGK